MKQNATIVLVPSSALDTMQLGGLVRVPGFEPIRDAPATPPRH
jgi:hypothetical protein